MMTKEAMKLALEALEGLEALLLSMGLTHLIVYGDAEKAITNLQEALAEQPAQHVLEVRVWRDKNHDQHAEFRGYDKLPDGEHVFYTSPQPAQQQETINGRTVKVDWKAQALELRELVRLGGIKIAELEAELAEQKAQQEPVAFVKGRGWRNGNLEVIPAKMNQTFDIDQPLYTSPPAQRTWVDLTDDEIKKEFHPLHATGLQFARAVLAKSKEKNA